MPPRVIPRTTKGSGAEYARRASEVLSAAFANDAFNSCVIRGTDGIADDVPITPEHRLHTFEHILKSRLDAGAELVEAADWAGAAIWRVISPDEKEIFSFF
jgi:hypothetical protein